MMRVSILAFAAVAMFAARANAQSSTAYPLTNMNFDMWCQETQKLPPERCDKRTPEDNAAFEAYRAKIEGYEIPYLQQRDRQNTVNRVILHNDPVDHPTIPSHPENPNPPDSPPK